MVDPRRVPYYLLLAGSPDQVPFEVQYQLGVSYAVGRLDLGDAEACAAYAASVVAAERSLDAPNEVPPHPPPAGSTSSPPGTRRTEPRP